MIENLTEEEISFLECLYDPICLIECLFGDVDNISRFDEEEFCEVRLAQYSMLSYEYIIDTERSDLNSKDNFKQREATGTAYCFGGRKYGKSVFIEILDLLVSFVHNSGELCGFSSYDAMHVRGILEKVIQALENHEFFIHYDAKINRSPNYRIFLKNGYSLISVNMNLGGENSGSQFFQNHFTRLYIEEASFETEEVYKKRLDAISENGCIYRVAGMTNFTKYSPAGRVFYDLNKRSQLINYPQYVSPKWDNKEKEKQVKEHSGEDSVSYRIFVRGEIVEDGISAIDMERVRKNYNDKKMIKHFEITKDNYPNFEHVLVVEKPGNIDTVYVASDIGETVTEIIVIFQIGSTYQYRYNITIYNLTDKEQYKIFRFLGETLKANFIALDCTEGMARAIFRSLEEVFPKENLIWVGFNEKIKVDVEKDANDKVLFLDGKPVWKEEYVDAWSIKHLRDLLYEEGKIDIPIDYKLDSQLNSVIAVYSGVRTLYKCVSPEDHLLAAWRVYAIAEWLNYLTISKPIQKKTFGKSGC